MVLAGNLKNKTKQRNHPPLAYSSSVQTWQSFLSTLGGGNRRLGTTFKEKVKGLGMQLLESPLDTRLSNNNINNNKNLNIWIFFFFGHAKEKKVKCVCSSQLKGAFGVFSLPPKVLKISRTLRPQRGRGWPPHHQGHLTQEGRGVESGPAPRTQGGGDRRC